MTGESHEELSERLRQRLMDPLAPLFPHELASGGYPETGPLRAGSRYLAPLHIVGPSMLTLEVEALSTNRVRASFQLDGLPRSRYIDFRMFHLAGEPW